MNSRRITVVSLATLVLALVVGALAASGDNPNQAKVLHAHVLTGFEEVPAISTDGTGSFRARISPDDSSVEYELSYSGLEGAVTMAHIHLGQRGVNGGIIVWLCGTDAIPGPPDTPGCPEPEGTVTGTFAADDIVGPDGQGIEPGDLEDALEAMRAGVTYVNVHSSLYPGGEIRGQLGPPRGGQR